MTKITLKCECGNEDVYDIGTVTDEYGVRQPDWSQLPTGAWKCSKCTRYMFWDGGME